MELVDLLEEMFQWQNPFCNTFMGPEGTIPSVDAMLNDIELPEVNLGPEQAAPASHPNSLSTTLWSPNPASITLSPSHSSRTIPVVASAIQAQASIRNPLAMNTRPYSVQTESREFETPAPAPNTPPVVKPKRSRGSATAKPKCPPKKRSPQELGLDAPGLKSKEKRVPSPAKHIIRERQRRDDMSAKYSILESLLPPTPKRERAVVVEDAISFVGALQRKKAQLLNRRAHLKLTASYNQAPRSKKTGSENCKSASPKLSGSSDGVVVRADPEIVTSTGTMSAIRVHIGEEEVLVEMVWNKPRPNFQSALLQAVQSLGFDVKQCSILRVGKGCIQCVVTCSKAPVDPMKCSMLSALAVTGAVAENIRDTVFFDIDYQSVEEYAHTELIQVQKRSFISLPDHPLKCDVVTK